MADRDSKATCSFNMKKGSLHTADTDYHKKLQEKTGGGWVCLNIDFYVIK
jgi:hypothetical protein